MFKTWKHFDRILVDCVSQSLISKENLEGIQNQSVERIKNLSLINRIIIGTAIGILLELRKEFTVFECLELVLLVSPSKAIAPLLVSLVMRAIWFQHKEGHEMNMKIHCHSILVWDICWHLSEVIASYAFPITMTFGRRCKYEVSSRPRHAAVLAPSYFKNCR